MLHSSPSPSLSEQRHQAAPRASFGVRLKLGDTRHQSLCHHIGTPSSRAEDRPAVRILGLPAAWTGLAPPPFVNSTRIKKKIRPSWPIQNLVARQGQKSKSCNARLDLARLFLAWFGKGVVPTGEETFPVAHCIVFQLRSLNRPTTLSRAITMTHSLVLSCLRLGCHQLLASFALPLGPSFSSMQPRCRVARRNSRRRVRGTYDIRRSDQTTA